MACKFWDVSQDVHSESDIVPVYLQLISRGDAPQADVPSPCSIISRRLVLHACLRLGTRQLRQCPQRCELVTLGNSRRRRRCFSTCKQRPGWSGAHFGKPAVPIRFVALLRQALHAYGRQAANQRDACWRPLLQSHGSCQHAFESCVQCGSPSSHSQLSPTRACAAAVRVRESAPLPVLAGRARFLPAAGAAAGLGGRGSLGGLGCLGGLAGGGPAAAARHLDTKGLPLGRIQLGSGRGAPVQQQAQRSQAEGASVAPGPGQAGVCWEDLLHPHHRHGLRMDHRCLPA